MDKLTWKVVSINNTLLPGPPETPVWIVQLQAVAGGSVQAGQLVLRLSAPPAYHPGDVIDYPPAPVPAPVPAKK